MWRNVSSAIRTFPRPDTRFYLFDFHCRFSRHSFLLSERIYRGSGNLTTPALPEKHRRQERYRPGVPSFLHGTGSVGTVPTVSSFISRVPHLPPLSPANTEAKPWYAIPTQHFPEHRRCFSRSDSHWLAKPTNGIWQILNTRGFTYASIFPYFCRLYSSQDVRTLFFSVHGSGRVYAKNVKKLRFEAAPVQYYSVHFFLNPPSPFSDIFYSTALFYFRMIIRGRFRRSCGSWNDHVAIHTICQLPPFLPRYSFSRTDGKVSFHPTVFHHFTLVFPWQAYQVNPYVALSSCWTRVKLLRTRSVVSFIWHVISL